MKRRRFRWTRAKYRRAHHLTRYLVRIREVYAPPPLVERYLALWHDHYARHSDRDPLTESIAYRLAQFKGDDVPF